MELASGTFPWIVRTPLASLWDDRDRVKTIVLSEFENWAAPKGQFSLPLASTDHFFSKLYDLFALQCLQYFQPFTLHQQSKRQCWAYVQDNRRQASVWHDHLLTSTINGVYYLAVPDPEGQIWFRFREQEIKVTPQEGWLYLFPRWLLHKPVEQTSAEPRISLNIEMITNEYPIARNGLYRW